MLDVVSCDIPSSPMEMPEWIGRFIQSSPEDCTRITSNPEHRRAIQSHCRALAELAYKRHYPNAIAAVHSCLSAIYANEFSAVPLAQVNSDIQPVVRDIASILEQAMLDYEYSSVDQKQIASYPNNGAEYIAWLRTLIAQHPAKAHPFYRDFLRDQATVEDIRFFLAQETNLDPRFDDILALMQIGTRGQAKMEIAGNYWDEMGNGDPAKVHTFLFQKALDALNVDGNYIANNMMGEAQASGNLSAALSLSRRHYYKAIGYFGVTEFLTPSRFRHLVAGWRRNELPEDGIIYHDTHIKIDAVHGAAWFNHVIAPAIDSNPQVGEEIAKGVLIRLNSSARYLDAMLDHLQTKDLDADAAYGRVQEKAVLRAAPAVG